MDNNLKNTILLASIGVAIGVGGIIAYYHQVSWLLILCAILCTCQMLTNLYWGLLKDYTYPLLAACMLIGYYITESFTESLCYGICLYYAIALFYICLLMVIPLQLLNFIIPLISIIAFFLKADHLFTVTGLFCTIQFVVSLLKGKLPYFAMDVFLWCIACGIVFLFIRDTDSSYHIRIIKGILCAGAAYYLFGILYAIYHTYIKKDNKYDDEKK